MDFELRNARRQASLTQAELSRHSGISLREVKAIESGEVANPHPYTLRQLMAALHPFGPCLFHCRSTTGDDFVLACASQTDALHAAVEFVIANCETAFHHAGEGSRLSDLHSLLAAHRWPEAIRFFNDWTDGSISIQPNPPESSLKGVVEPAFPL